MSKLKETGYSKICLVTTTFPPYPNEATKIAVGGATTDLIALVAELKNKGFKVTVVALDFPGTSKNTDPANVIRIGLYFPYTSDGLAGGLRFASNEFVNPIVLIRLLSVVHRINPEIIILGEVFQLGITPHLVASILRIPMYLRYDWICPSFPEEHTCSFFHRFNNCADCLNSKKDQNFSIFSKVAFNILASFVFLVKVNFWRKHARAILAVNDFYKNYYLNYGIAEEKVLVVPPGGQLTILTQKPLIFPLSDKSFKVLFVGRLSREKGILVLLDAFEMITKSSSDVKLVIAGDGPLRTAVEDYQRKFPQVVTYLGWIGGSNLSQAYQECTIVVIPSIVPEGHPVVADEAMQFKKTLVGFGLGGLKEILGSYKNSVMVQNVSSKSLAEAIMQITKDIT